VEEILKFENYETFGVVLFQFIIMIHPVTVKIDFIEIASVLAKARDFQSQIPAERVQRSSCLQKIINNKVTLTSPLFSQFPWGSNTNVITFSKKNLCLDMVIP
jgi:hypothetical protein